MAAEVAIINPLHIPGLDQALTRTDLAVARNTYNGLPYIAKQKEFAIAAAKRIPEAIALIIRHDMSKNFRPHLAHRHNVLDSGQVRLETEMEGTPYRLTKPAMIDNVDFGNMHPTCFKVTGNDLVAFEFAKGPTPLNATKIPAAFVQAWVAFIDKHELANLLTLDFGSFGKDGEPTTEIELQIGTDTPATIKAPVSHCIRKGTNVPTSWRVSAPSVGDPEGPGPGEHWNESTKPDGTKTHKVHVDNLSGSLGDSELVDALVELGVLRAS
ncbi:hypothetical protein EKO27_g7733 [Xylaria grammica]|uniref:Uncharacterized protein n=1 Tax=Xylaria grammica TaxID=363999 RepID=A0A439CZE6_9PEZI|nr:hypothetical protein EKO27_g7733 [Xylaria grammica]